MWHTATIFVETMIISMYCGSVTGFAAGVENCPVLIELDPKPTEDDGSSSVDLSRFWSKSLRKLQDDGEEQAYRTLDLQHR